MTTLREAAEMALTAMEEAEEYGQYLPAGAIDTLREALAQPEPEPVAWTTMPDANDGVFISGSNNPNGKLTGKWLPLYTSPPKRKPLTNDEMRALWESHGYKSALCMRFARAIERAHGIGGGE